jgi:hypothetical protein
MSEKKSIKRAAKAVWDEVKQLRADRRKSSRAADIIAAGEALAAHADKLTALGKEMSAPNPCRSAIQSPH